MADRSGTWSLAQRRLHWVMAVLVAMTALLAPVMVALPFERLLEKFLAYQMHKSLGLLVPLLLVPRLLLRAFRGRPMADATLPSWQRRAASVTHGLLYGLLLVVPGLGLLAASAAPGGMPTLLFLVIPVPHPIAPDTALFAILRAVHLTLALLLLALATGHAVMAVRHHWRGRPVLRAMWRGLPLT